MAEEYLLEHPKHGRKIATLWAEAENDFKNGWSLVPDNVELKQDTLPCVDFDGIEWDKRIHQKNRSKSRDGRWKRKVGISDDFYYKIMAELIRQ